LNLKEQLNLYGSNKEPFLFIIDFDLINYKVIPLKSLPKDVKYKIDNINKYNKHNTSIDKESTSYKEYKIKFDKVQNQILDGNTYLLNLTSKTKITTNLKLNEIFDNSNGRFKLLYKDKFVCFSPERFCEIKDNKIYTYPMKGTIDASIPNAEKIILEDTKELAEHTMVVDLLRNDLSIISKKVTVERFRYSEKIKAGNKELIQISSKISGELEKDWRDNIGDILTNLLPAGSITGTPKKKTIDIIKNIEEYDRGYFTGVFGVFDGNNLDSAVMIRFIEKQDDGTLIYKSGGGITSDSDPISEYEEMCDKVYIP